MGGLPVRGNRTTDQITVLVGQGGPVAWTHYWPDIEVEPSNVDFASATLTVAEALAAASDGIARIAKGEVRLVTARRVYGTLGAGRGRGRHLVPAYELIADDGSTVVVDAMSGLLLL